MHNWNVPYKGDVISEERAEQKWLCHSHISHAAWILPNCLLGASWPRPTLAPALSNTRCRSLNAVGAGGCVCVCMLIKGKSGECSGWVHHQGHGLQHTVSAAVTSHRHKQATWSLTTQLTLTGLPLCFSLSLLFCLLLTFLCIDTDDLNANWQWICLEEHNDLWACAKRTNNAKNVTGFFFLKNKFKMYLLWILVNVFH